VMHPTFTSRHGEVAAGDTWGVAWALSFGKKAVVFCGLLVLSVFFLKIPPQARLQAGSVFLAFLILSYIGARRRASLCCTDIRCIAYQ
jgi:hypothetical protein